MHYAQHVGCEGNWRRDGRFSAWYAVCIIQSMDTHARTGKPLALEPLDLPTPGGKAAEAAPAASIPRLSSDDPFLEQASKEYEAGNIDQPLWDRTAARHGGDKAMLVAAYLRSRATALQMRKRNERTIPRGLQPVTTKAPTGELPAPTKLVPPKLPDGRRKLMVGVAAAGVVTAVGIAWLLMSPRNADVAVIQPPAVGGASVPKKSAAPPAAPAAPVNEPPAVSLETKVQEFKRAGNWNVLVLYAAEWTRKQPDDANAWTELSAGYLKLRQWGDAFEAAQKAVQLAPDDLKHWRNFGHVTLVVERLPEAKTTFDRILATFPDDIDALCGASIVARGENRPKDAEMLAARVKALGVGCDGVFEGLSLPTAAVSVPAPVAASPAPPRRTGGAAAARNR